VANSSRADSWEQHGTASNSSRKDSWELPGTAACAFLTTALACAFLTAAIASAFLSPAIADAFLSAAAACAFLTPSSQLCYMEVQADLVICGLFICEFAYMRSRNMDQNSLYAIFYFNLPHIYAIFNKNQEF
jgi:hypothetical protein